MNPTEYWRGDVGTEYQRRNVGRVGTNIAFFSKILARTVALDSVIELGAGTGENLLALRKLRPTLELSAVELNHEAVRTLHGRAHQIFEESILQWVPTSTWGMAFTKGVLIHIQPDLLEIAYAKLWSAAKRYILVAEYYNPTPVEVEYRGQSGVLWKRDFAGEMLDIYGGRLRLVDYGFVWRRDQFSQDDLTWFLMEKQ